MSYQVFARKYRPQTFEDVLGQDHVVRTLRNAIAQQRLAHAYLFVGPRGTGKTSTARIFAKALCCKDGPSIDFDPNDELCIEIAEGRCMDVLEIDGASNNGVEQVRELRDNVKYAPSRCRYKIYYIDEVHMLTTGAFNALLKTLEEPPEHVKFIFATTEPNKILPTIISRCQRFDLRRIPNAVIAKHLLHIAKLENVSLDEKAAYAIGKGAEGGMRDAQSMLDQLVAFCGGNITEQDVLDVFGFTSGEAVAQLARHILESNTVGALRAVYEQNEAGKELGRFLGDLIQHFRTLLVQQADPEAAAEDLSPEVAEEVIAQAQMANTEQLLRVVDGLADVDARMRWASNKRLHFELGVIASVQSLNEVSISDVIDALDSGSGEGLPRQAPRVQAAPAPLRRAAEPVKAAPVVKPQPVVREETPAPAVVRAPEPEPQPVAKAAPVVERAPAPVVEKAPEPAPAPPLVVAAKVKEDSPVGDPEELFGEDVFWSKFVTQVQVRRPLAVSWVQAATLLSITRNTIKVGFPPSESFARDSLMRPAQVSFLEGLAQEVTGKAMKFEFVLDPSLKAPVFAEIDLGLLNEPGTAAKPAEAPKVEAKAAAKVDAPKTAELDIPAAAPKPPEDFYNDALIQQAMVKFKARLVTAE
ncbi:MAG: DNA polymerase III subunit gamma/tau [Prosthecobacter sp.]|uniref:DNA polymerase III subunit gamma/tau n=1 Tax=Prosthecobacter sp. TaxID=1965333 RepID=UPI00262A1F5C|nr:DNA polymerase III subunit gamma/tau [Prosthecobacter sp.]MCF7789475.1 DNA polymerase III subunit gamma/tau [Prosthecobacter sp.]